MKPRELPLALFILRIGLGLFLLLWSVDKIVVPETTVKIFSMFYKTPLTADLAPLVGVAEALLSIAFLAGAWRTWTYGAGLAIHTVSTLSTWQQLISPFGKNHLFIAAIPVLAGFVVLFLLRRHDELWTLRIGRG